MAEVSESSAVCSRGLVKCDDDDDGDGDARPSSFGNCPEILLSRLLQSLRVAQALLIVIGAAGKAMGLLEDDERPLCRYRA